MSSLVLEPTDLAGDFDIDFPDMWAMLDNRNCQHCGKKHGYVSTECGKIIFCFEGEQNRYEKAMPPFGKMSKLEGDHDRLIHFEDWLSVNGF